MHTSPQRSRSSLLTSVSVLFPDSGGGVGGLVCAVALSRHPDIHIDVYEAAAAFTEIGAGIGVWPRAWKVLCALGLAEDLAKIAVVPPTDLPRACCAVAISRLVLTIY